MQLCPIIFFIYIKHWRHSPKCLATFPGMFEDILWNSWRHTLECLGASFGMFDEISWNVGRHFPECLTTFLRMFEDITRNVWQHSPEYKLPPFPRVPRILFPVPVFPVLYITANVAKE